MDDAARILNGDALARTVPPRIDEVSTRAVLLHLADEFMRILCRMEFEERLTEARGERRGRLGDAALRAREFRREAREEVVLRLLRRQDRDGRQHAECIGREEDDVLCMRACRLLRDLAQHDVLDVINRIGDARILRHRLIRKVHVPSEIDGHVLEKSITANSVVDVGLRLGVEVDDLRVAAALIVEDALIIPAVLVVTNQEALRVRRERRLARAGKAEEQRRILAVHIRICRAVHGGDALQREIVVHHREHTLFHLAAIPRIDDDLLTAREVEHDRRLGVQAEIAEMHDARLRRIVDHEIGLEVLELLCRRTNEHIRHEMRLPRHFDDEADGHAGIFVGSAEGIDDKETLVAELADRDLAHGVPRFLRGAVVVVLVGVGGPPHRVMRGLIVHDVLILRRTSRVDARHDVDGVLHIRDLSALVALEIGAQFLAEQLIVVRIVDNLRRPRDAVLCQINICHSYLFLPKDRCQWMRNA